MKISLRGGYDQDFEPFFNLLQIMRDDPRLNDKVITLLKLDSCERRAILNYWLEQLRQQNSHENLCRALSCLFDEKVSAEELKIFIN